MSGLRPHHAPRANYSAIAREGEGMSDHTDTLLNLSRPRGARSVLLPVRVTPEERAALRAVAKRENMTVADFIRAAIALRTRDVDREPLGQWLVDNIPRGLSLEVPRDRASRRRTPFAEDGPG